ncbi:DUF58 domain-containing protein [Terriglobus sp. RCC_193]|uniref:DUF58 domain-containing protein n=1 Tax=Terriglobus sp. RCC_193 TaxID=3239218 RepID=UPI003524E249
MQTLIPLPVTAVAHPKGERFGRLLGFGATPRLLLLLAASVLLSIPAFLASRTPWLMFGFDTLLLGTFIVDAILLPAPERFQISRRFLHAPELGAPAAIELQAAKSASGIHTLRFTDDLHVSLLLSQPIGAMVSYPTESSTVKYLATPSQRGDLALGKLYFRYRSAIGFAERWAVADLRQTIRVYAAGEKANESAELFLLRARQIELEKRRLRRIGLGREFEQLREYRTGDELRNISWKATARHNRLITQQFTTERSQQVWIVLDAGRLSRTTFALGKTSTANGEEHATQIVTQLDQATAAAGQLARVIQQSGDRSALLTYGRGVQQQLLPSSGTLHLRRMIDALSQVRSETAEADHLMASVRLRQLQRRRGLVLWVTEMTETAGRPEIVTAVSALVRRHLVVLVLLQQPELEALAVSSPKNAHEMYAITAAQEMLDRRRTLLAQLRSQGVLVVETSAANVASDSISKYLEVKSQGQL